ncbi:Metallo-dependent phosphatase-like protein [Aspergillus egyptiacus]|nr:Metallo-dependent phosphatase-like protein [Aspergillus egyptiacus]
MADRDRDRETLDFSDDISEDGLYHPSSSPSPSSRFTRFARPLIDYVRNEWQSPAKYTHFASVSDRSESPKKWAQVVLSIVTAPRFRRYVVVYLGLVVSCLAGWRFFLSPMLKENSAILKSLDPKQQNRVGGWFGGNAVPFLEDVVQLRELNSTLLPAKAAPEEGEESSRRLIVVGDVHGCKTELENLLNEVSFDNATDHLIFTGDLIEKGPDSLGVVDLARQYNASCVRGNHEDRVLTLRHDMLRANMTGDSMDIGHPQNSKSRQLARELSEDQANYLDACPVILDVGEITNMGQVVVVHAGLVSGVELEKQDPYSVMNMLTVDLSTHTPSTSRKTGTKWTKLFNRHQAVSLGSKTGVTTVIYGHDAKTGLNLKEYTKGLDSGCVKGGKLTALVISDGGEQKTVQVRCSNHMKE